MAQFEPKDWMTIVVIPIVVALVAAYVSSAIQKSQKRVKYIEIAVGVLDKKPSPETAAIREWAIQVMAEYSEVAIDDKMKEALRKYPIYGEIVGTLNQTLDDVKFKSKGTVR
jgi:hypothetical protein